MNVCVCESAQWCRHFRGGSLPRRIPCSASADPLLVLLVSIRSVNRRGKKKIERKREENENFASYLLIIDAMEG